MNKRRAFMDAPRCCATSKRTGNACQAPAVRGWRVCRFHGAGGGAPEGRRNGAYRTGLHTVEAVAFRREAQGLMREARATLEAMRGAIDGGDDEGVWLVSPQDR